MRKESAQRRARLTVHQCQTRILRIYKIVNSFRSSLSHPHDFYPSAPDICWIPEVQKIIVDGTDEEFLDCEADIQSRIPKLSVIWLEERRKFFLQFLPQDSPSLEHLSLATTLFDCTGCREFGMRIENALSHTCRHNCRSRSDCKFTPKSSNAASANAFHDKADPPWDPEVSRYRYSAELSALVREVVLECGENPDTITTQEMNRKHHRFVCFRDGGVDVLNWSQAVSSEAHLPDDPIPDPRHPVSSTIGATAKRHRVGSCSPTNYRNMYLGPGIRRVLGVASTAGGQGTLNAVAMPSL